MINSESILRTAAPCNEKGGYQCFWATYQIELQQSANEDQWFISDLIQQIPMRVLRLNSLFFVQPRSTSCLVRTTHRYPQLHCTLLYVMESNSWLMSSGLCTSSSLDDRGWEEAKASTPITPTISFRTIKSFWKIQREMFVFSIMAWLNSFSNKDDCYICVGSHWSHLQRGPCSIIQQVKLQLGYISARGQDSPYSTMVQHSRLRDKRRRWQSPRWATGRSTTL